MRKTCGKHGQNLRTVWVRIHNVCTCFGYTPLSAWAKPLAFTHFPQLKTTALPTTNLFNLPLLKDQFSTLYTGLIITTTK